MPRFGVPLYIEVEADNADAAFANVRTNFCICSDPNGEVKQEGTHDLIEFVVDEQSMRYLEEDESVCA